MSEEAGRITAIIDADISRLSTDINQAKSIATSGVAGIETSIKGQMGAGIAGAFSGGDWATAGRNIGQTFISNITSSFGPLGTALEGVATALGPTGVVALAAIAGGAVIAKSASDAAMAWEAGMSGIAKTTEMAKGTEEFAALNEELKDLYATMPTTMSEIQGVAKAAGSLGIEKDSIAGYTKVALQMGSAFDIPAEEAATAVGKVQSQLKALPEGVGDSADFARKFGSAVDYAGNSMNATEAEVLDFSTRTAGALSLLGGSAYELAGWGGATASVFSSSQLAAGSFNAALTQLTGTTKGSIEAQGRAAELLGVTTDEFSKMMSTDPSDTVLRLGNALEELDPAEATKAAGILGGGYGDDFFKKMIGHTDEWRGKIEEVVAAGEKGESIGNSFEAGADNAKSGLQELKNTVSTMLIDIGGPINDIANAVAGPLADGLNKVREIGENLWGPLTTTLSPLTTGISNVVELVGTLSGMQLDGLVKGSEAINKAFELGGKYAGAIRDEIAEMRADSDAFQTVAGYVDDIGDSFGNLHDKVTEVFDKIVDGLTNAIPTAIKGTADALGTLGEKAGLGGVSDAAGGIFDFFGDVNARVWGEDAGNEMADGIKGSGLKNAPADTIKLSESDAIAAASDLGERMGHAIGEKVSYESSQSMSENLVGKGKSKWKTSQGEIVGTATVGGVEIAAELEVTNSSSDVILKTESGQELDRRSIYGGQFNGDSQAAIMNMIQAHPDIFGGLSELEQADFSGDVAKAETMRITSGAVDLETTTEARLKELSSLDLDQMRANITEIETSIAGLSEALKEVDNAFSEMSIKPIDMTIALQTEQARTDWASLVSDIEGMTVMLPVELSIRAYADEIYAMVDSAIRSALA
jgi:TP901 family phage tail tape measure protein